VEDVGVGQLTASQFAFKERLARTTSECPALVVYEVFQGGNDRWVKHDDALTAELRVADQDLSGSKIEVVHSKPECLGYPQARGREQADERR
jgi:hypothetical protein